MALARKVRTRLVVIGSSAVVLSLFIAFVLPGLLFPQQPRLSEEIYAELFPFESRYLELEGGSRIHYVDEGQGPTILLFHGNPASAFLYRHIIAELRADFRVIAFDYPGFGRSTAPPDFQFTAQEQAETALQFFDAINPDQAVIMVQDWGGPIGFHVAQNRPAQIRGLVVGNTWAWPLAGRFRYEAFSWIMGGPIGRGITSSRIGVVHLFLKRGVIRPLSNEAYAGYFQTFIDGDRTPVTTFPRELVAAKDFLAKLENGMALLHQHETLIVWGEQDFAFGEDFRRRFESYLPKHRTVLLPNAGHFIQEDAPDVIAQAIREHFGPPPIPTTRD